MIQIATQKQLFLRAEDKKINIGDQRNHTEIEVEVIVIKIKREEEAVGVILQDIIKGLLHPAISIDIQSIRKEIINIGN